MATPTVQFADVLTSCFFFKASQKQLYIWPGMDVSVEQRGGRGPTAQCVNERGPEGDGSQQAPVVFLAAFQSRLRFLLGLWSYQVMLHLSWSSFIYFRSLFHHHGSLPLLTLSTALNRNLLEKHSKDIFLSLKNAQQFCVLQPGNMFLQNKSLLHTSAWQFPFSHCFFPPFFLKKYVFTSISVSMCIPVCCTLFGNMSACNFFLFIHVCLCMCAA